MFDEKRKKLLKISFVITFTIFVVTMLFLISPGKRLEDARNSARDSHVLTIKKTITIYRTYNGGEYPRCIPDYPQIISLDECSDLLRFMVNVPKDPQRHEYQIKYTDSKHMSFEVFSTAPEWLNSK